MTKTIENEVCPLNCRQDVMTGNICVHSYSCTTLYYNRKYCKHVHLIIPFQQHNIQEQLNENNSTNDERIQTKN